jgi:hypothetical protein
VVRVCDQRIDRGADRRGDCGCGDGSEMHNDDRGYPVIIRTTT